jgi:hypothetical protein
LARAALRAGVFGVPSEIGLQLPCDVIVRGRAPERVVVGFLDPQIVVNLVGKAEVTGMADAAEQLLRGVRVSLGVSVTLATRRPLVRGWRCRANDQCVRRSHCRPVQLEGIAPGPTQY